MRSSKLIESRAVGALFVFAFASALSAQETDYVHRVGGREAGAVKVTRKPAAVVAEGTGSTEGVRLRATVEFSERGTVSSYERELRGAGGALVGRVSVLPTDEGARIRDSGPLGSRNRTARGGSFDAVVDAAFPEALFVALADRAKGSLRVLLVAEAEVRTVLVEPRGERARFVDLPGGGLTIRYGADGRPESMSLPGAQQREIIRADLAAVVAGAPLMGEETRFVVEGPDGVRIGASLLKPVKATVPPLLVVLIGDAGQLDRDGAGAGRHVPTLRHFASELALLGAVVVRADKRGAGESMGPEPALADLVHDVVLVLREARSRIGPETGRVLIVGHGEGAVVGAEFMATNPESADGLVLLAGPGRALGEALDARLRARLAGAGESAETVELEAAQLRAEIAKMRDLPRAESAPAGRKLLRDLASLDPATQLTRVRAPILALHATDDPEVPHSHVSLLRASLAFSSGGRVRFHFVERADHDFLLVPAGRSGARAEIGSADPARAPHPSVGALIFDFASSLK